MNDVRITTTSTGKIHLLSPYNPAMPPKARAIGGRFDRATKAWEFDARDEQRVRDLARELFGTDGSPEADADLVTVRVRLADHEVSYREGATARFAGREIAHRPSRDADVRLAANVVLIEGRLPGRGGSVRYPEIDAGDDVIVEIRDLPRAALQVESPDDYEIVGETVDTEALRTERDRLLARLAEIDAALAAAGEPTGDAGGQADGQADEASRAVPAADTTAGVITVRIDTEADGIDGASTKAFAAAAGRSARTIRRWCAAGRIPARRVGRRWVITN